MTVELRLGAVPVGPATRFEVWAPEARAVEVLVAAPDGQSRAVPLGPDERSGTWVGVVDGVGHGDRYRFRLDDGEPAADPASGWQPEGVHGPSAVVDAGRYEWSDDSWRGVELGDTVLYELHVGTFTREGTLDAAIGQLGRLVRLGITSVELMPVNAFPGARNWGYDGVFPSAVQATYGGPDALARFVDAAHGHGLAVVLDVVYNHLGPEGAVHPRFGPYFVDTYHTPWGDGLNVAEAGSDHVRRTFIESATRWITDFHVDGLRLDAIDQIYDPTAEPFLAQLIDAVHTAGHRAGRTVLTFVETAANNPDHVLPRSRGGLDSDAAWNDDVHHALRVALTGDTRGYYVDYLGAPDVAEAFANRWVFTGRYSTFRERHHGRPADDVEPEHFVAFSSNHDHVGNTPAGARPPFDHRRRLVAAATIVLGPFTPMLFMGEEYAETRPFPYFVDHSDPTLLQAVREGRRKEFAKAEWTEAVADPADPATFEAAVLDPSVAELPPHSQVLATYTELLSLRRLHGVIHDPGADQRVRRTDETVIVERRREDRRSVLVLHLGADPTDVAVDGDLEVVFDTGDERWGGAGSALLDGTTLRLDGPAAVLLLSR